MSGQKKMNKTGIKDRLIKGFIQVSMLASAVAVVACVVIFVLSARYQYAMEHYGFSQGDIGKAMVAFSEARSSVRFVIGSHYLDASEEAKKVYFQKKEELAGYMEDFRESIVMEDELAVYNNITSELESYWKLSDDIMELGVTMDEEKNIKAETLALDQLAPKYDKLYDQFNALMLLNVDKGDEVQSQLLILEVILVAGVGVVILLVFAMSMRLGGRIAKGICNPIASLKTRLGTFAEGDLTSEFPVMNTEDEVADMVKEASDMAENLRVLIEDLAYILDEMAKGNFAIKTRAEDRYVGDFAELLQSIRRMNRNMNDALHEIESASEQVSSGSSNMAEGAQSMAEGATDQAGAVEQLQATITTITEHVEKTSLQVEESYRKAQNYAKEADDSRQEMDLMVAAMNRINETTKKVANIVSEIEDIASQTNLLSLNASIEAARAGEAGKGFAVVADQIRKLAEQSAQSAVNTRELIEGAQKEVADGNSAAESAATSIENVLMGVKAIAESSRELSEITNEQAHAMEQAEIGINQISEVIQQNSATAQQTSATSQELSAQAISMNELVGRFTLKD